MFGLRLHVSLDCYFVVRGLAGFSFLTFRNNSMYKMGMLSRHSCTNSISRIDEIKAATEVLQLRLHVSRCTILCSTICTERRETYS